ncbi:MAG TPA: hypothetical protein VKZ53_15905 [Candidatus Angelobacter sp.]|nr:hypothetical protein [Candidatus Angelobacter sp.]
MLSFIGVHARRRRVGSVVSASLCLLAWAVCLLLCAFPIQAKDSSLTAIVLYDDANGAAFVQVTGITLNAKTELRACADNQAKFDKRSYDLLPKVQLVGATSLERNRDGVMMLTIDVKSSCVIPANLHFEKNAELTPAEAADQSLLQGTVISSSSGARSSEANPAPQGAAVAIPAFKPGVRIVFIAAPDAELAEYLRAQRSNSVAGWQEFLQHHGSFARAADAKQSLAGIYEKAAETAFARYTQSHDISQLKEAQQQALQADKTAAGFPAANRLVEQIARELDTLIEPDRAKLLAYRKSLQERSAGGYAQLMAAVRHSDQVASVNPGYAPVANFHRELTGEAGKVDAALQNAEASLAARRYEEALRAVEPYRAFASEMPRVDAVVSAVFAAHMARGQELSGQQNWEQAAAEYRKALEIRSNSREASDALKSVSSQLTNNLNREAANRAVLESRSDAEKGQWIEAYDVLANLPESQRPFVADQMIALKKDYVLAASKRAQRLQEIHLPIRGRADEEAMQQAYDLLERAGGLSGDPGIKLKLDLLSDKLSAYYVDQARRYLEKPLGSGIGIGWLYLAEAQRYKPSLDTVKDEIARNTAAYQLRSKLSVGVVLRDQTSRRDSPGFADQLTDAIVTGLESSGLTIKVVRQPKEGSDAMPPGFLLVGEILQHRNVKNASLETLPSKYRAGTHEVKSELWLKASNDYDAAQKDLAATQKNLADAQAQHKKKEVVAAANDAVTAAQKQADDLRHKMDTVEQNRSQDVIEPYNYTKKSIDLTGVVELAFRITDPSGNVVEHTTPVHQESHKTFVVLDNVKPEDTEGIKKQNTEPDENQFLTDLELQARDILVKSVREKVLLLPGKLLQGARTRLQQGDIDGAAEDYIRYLNSVAAASPEHDEAAKFLRDHYNLAISGNSQPAIQTQVQAR